MNRNTEDEAAAGAAAGARCSEATLRGRYLFAYDGVDISKNVQVPFAYAGYQEHDGRRAVHGRFSGNFNGTVTSPPESFSGTYTVNNADCTGEVTTKDGSKYDLFIAPDGSMFTFVQTRPKDVVASGTAHRVSR